MKTYWYLTLEWSMPRFKSTFTYATNKAFITPECFREAYKNAIGNNLNYRDPVVLMIYQLSEEQYNTYNSILQ